PHHPTVRALESTRLPTGQPPSIPMLKAQPCQSQVSTPRQTGPSITRSKTSQPTPSTVEAYLTGALAYIDFQPQVWYSSTRPTRAMTIDWSAHSDFPFM